MDISNIPNLKETLNILKKNIKNNIHEYIIKIKFLIKHINVDGDKNNNNSFYEILLNEIDYLIQNKYIIKINIFTKSNILIHTDEINDNFLKFLTTFLEEDKNLKLNKNNLHKKKNEIKKKKYNEINLKKNEINKIKIDLEKNKISRKELYDNILNKIIYYNKNNNLLRDLYYYVVSVIKKDYNNFNYLNSTILKYYNIF